MFFYINSIITFNLFVLRHKLGHEVSLIANTKSSKQHADLQEKRNMLTRQIVQWQEIQLVYMPTIAPLFLKTGTIGADNNSIGSDTIPLYLPSSLSLSLRNTPILSPLIEKKHRLHIGQAEEALEGVRHGQQMLTGLVQFKKLNITGAGNKANTRLHTVVNHLQARI